ncbi:MAG: hypothetical protein AAF226_14715, partial [Verrucomicrobiota bacterium]
VTAMSVSAIIESETSADDAEIGASLDKGISYLVKELPQVRRAAADAIYNVWTHGYGIKALADVYHHTSDEELKAKIPQLINGQLNRLERYASIDGGWGYYDFRARTAVPSSSSMSFTTATILAAIKSAEDIPGLELSDKMIERALDSIQRQRKGDQTYFYGEYLWSRPMRGINRTAGSLGRTQACSYALRVWGDETVTDEVLIEWLEKLESRQGWLDMGRKRPIPHEAWAGVAGYFYYYGHYYAAQCVTLLPEELSSEPKTMLTKLMLDRQESDGSWWDFPFYSYHQTYGTAYAVMTLVRCR